MERKKIRVLCVYPRNSQELKTVSERMAGAFNREEYLPATLPAGRVEIPQVNASDIILFGIEGNVSDVRSSGYGELLRALSGMNLAGKVAGILSSGSGPVLDVLRKLLLDADAALVEPVLLQNMNESTDGLQELQTRIVLNRKEMIDAGKQFS